MTGWMLVALIVIAAAAFLLASGFLKTFRMYHGVRVITCPENLQPAAVSVAAFDAAKWFAVSGEKELHLRKCSRWPEMAGCDEGCVSQIKADPNSCLVHTIVTAWYAGKHCYFCNRAIGEVVWHERPPAVRLADGRTMEWKEIAAEDLKSVFATGDAVCWPCLVVEGFRRDHPEKVVERLQSAAPRHTIPPSQSVY